VVVLKLLELEVGQVVEVLFILQITPEEQLTLPQLKVSQEAPLTILGHTTQELAVVELERLEKVAIQPLL